MTLAELFMLIRKHWVPIIAITAVCALAGLAFGFMSSANATATPSATARIVANSQATTVSSIASSKARAFAADSSDSDSKYNAKISVESGTTTVAIEVTGPEESECVRIADKLASDTLEQAQDFYASTDVSDSMVTFKAQIEPAGLNEVVEAGNGKSVLKYLLLGLLGGVFIAVCLILVIDMVRRPVKSIESVQEAVDLPVIEKLPIRDNGERLLANVRFASGETWPKSVVVVPVGKAESGAAVAQYLQTAIAAEQNSDSPASKSIVQASDMKVRAVKPLSETMSGAYEAKGSDAAIIVVRQWFDRMDDLNSTAAELQLAGAKTVGVVFVAE